MLLDDLLHEFDATRIEHRVVPGSQAGVYAVAVHVDFIEVVRHNIAVRSLFGARAGAERLAAAVRRSGPPAPAPELDALRLEDLPERGDWIRLGEDPPHELAFGVVGRFWSGETVWEEIDAAGFASFERPGYARIGCNLSFRPYGDERTLVSYEARTQATDPASRRAFLRYWRVVSPFVGVVMRSTLSLIAEETARPR
jgi:hypothetical protein